MAQLTGEGLVIDRQPEILDNLKENAQQDIDSNISIRDDELLGQSYNILALELAKAQELLEAVNNGSNIEARMNMITAASMGSTAFQKGLGAIHSLSHPVNALNNVHHGLSNAIFMPYVLTFNKDVIEDKIIKICNYLELKDRSFDGFINWVLDLRKKLDMPHKLSEVIEEKDLQLDRLSKMALADPSTGGNPKKLTEADMKVMYQHSMSGTLF